MNLTIREWYRLMTIVDIHDHELVEIWHGLWEIEMIASILISDTGPRPGSDRAPTNQTAASWIFDSRSGFSRVEEVKEETSRLHSRLFGSLSVEHFYFWVMREGRLLATRRTESKSTLYPPFYWLSRKKRLFSSFWIWLLVLLERFFGGSKVSILPIPLLYRNGRVGYILSCVSSVSRF